MSDYVRKNNSLPIEKIRKPSTYDEFIYWLAMPTPAKMKMGIETQTQFAEFFKVSERTLLRWKESEQLVDKDFKVFKDSKDFRDFKASKVFKASKDL